MTTSEHAIVAFLSAAEHEYRRQEHDVEQVWQFGSPGEATQPLPEFVVVDVDGVLHLGLVIEGQSTAELPAPPGSVSEFLAKVGAIRGELTARAAAFRDGYDFGARETVLFSRIRLFREDDALVVEVAAEFRVLLGKDHEYGTDELFLDCRTAFTEDGARVTSRVRVLNDSVMGEFPPGFHTVLEHASAVLPPDEAGAEAVAQLKIFTRLDGYASRLGLLEKD